MWSQSAVVQLLTARKNSTRALIRAAILLLVCVCMQAAMHECALVSLKTEAFWWERFCLSFGGPFHKPEPAIGPSLMNIHIGDKERSSHKQSWSQLVSHTESLCSCACACRTLAAYEKRSHATVDHDELIRVLAATELLIITALHNRI